MEQNTGWSGVALDILRKNKMLAQAGIQTPDGPFPSPVITLTTLCRFLSTLAAGLLKCYINYPARNPQDSPIGLFTFGTVQVRKLLSRCLRLNPHNLQTDKLTVSLLLLITLINTQNVPVTKIVDSSSIPLRCVIPVVCVTRWEGGGSSIQHN